MSQAARGPRLDRETAAERHAPEPDWLAALGRGEGFPGPAADLVRIETHISWIFLAGERAYKLKKPVELGFLDFSTLERRKHFCEEELRLNQRLAPGVYLGVVPLARAPGGELRLGGEGEVLEWAVEMRRLPARRMLSALLEAGEIDNAKLEALAVLLARFHAESPTGPGVDEHGSPEAVRANVEENFEQLLPFVHPRTAGDEERERALSPLQHAHLRAAARRFLDAERRLFVQRVREGRVREGHGDLHAGNLCLLEEGFVAYDCIEFSRRFRCGDVAAELAFLAMDLDQRGFPAFARYLLGLYAREADDPGMLALAGFYKGYRAVVRGKVESFAAAGLAGEERAAALAGARRHLQLAVGYELPPALVLMCGLPACGKSWLARELARPLRAARLSSDARRRVLGAGTGAHESGAGYGQGAYTPERKRLTYRALLEDAARHLRSGRSVVVDATFSKAALRAPFLDAAARLGRPYCLVRVVASEERTRARLAARAHDPGELSEADLGVYFRERERFEPPDEVAGGHVLEVASEELPPELVVSRLLDRLISAG